MAQLFELFKQFRSSHITLMGYALLAVFLLFNISHFKSYDEKLEQHYQAMVNSERQVNLISEMHIHARTRSRYMLIMLLSDDPFLHEELATDFYDRAGRFRQASTELVSYPLTQTQQEMLAAQEQIINDNAQLQVDVVNAILNQHYDEAKELLFNHALPEQNRILAKLQRLSDSLKASAELAGENYQKALKKDELYASILHSSLFVFILLIGGYSFQKIRQNEAQQKTKVESLTHQVHSQAAINAMDALILSEMSDYIALVDAQGHFIRTNPKLEKLLADVSIEASTPIWTWLLDHSNLSPAQFHVMKQQILKQAWRHELYFHNNPSFYALCEVRPFHSPQIEHARYLVSVADISELKKAQQALENQANFDAVTQLPNRHYFQNQLANQLNNLPKERFSLLYLDLDDFKKVNDSLGHDFGDALLKAVSHRMHTLLLEHFFDCFELARIGGDEFAVILSEQNQDLTERTAEMAQHLCDKISAPYEILNHNVVIGCSIGIALYPKQADDMTRLMRCADLAMYHAKANGKNTFAFFTEQLNQKLEEQLQLEQKLKLALQQNQFQLYYQKQFNLHDLSLSGLEALVRWGLEDDLILPSEFIPFAEQHQLMEDIDLYVIQKAFAQLSEWKQQQTSVPRLAINISANHLHQPTLYNTLESLLESNHLKGSDLDLEVTEYSLVQNVEQNHDCEDDCIKRIADLGIQISIDDFGTGYSSLAYIKHLNIDRLKIDRSFIHDMQLNNESYEIVKTIINLGHSVGCKVLAEGIETQEQLQLLTELGCDEGQGFLLHRPEAAQHIQLTH